MTLGFEQAGFEVLAAFDVEPFNLKTHKVNFPHTSTLHADLSKESGESLRTLAKLADKDIDVVFGGPPCQGFSYGGHQNMEDERNLLVYDFARLVRQLRPKYFVMENVKGIMSVLARPILQSFVRRIRNAGYCIVEPIQILNAADYGVPQRRWRTFILGYRKGLAPPIYPEPHKGDLALLTSTAPLVIDAISDLPVLEEYDHLFEMDTFEGPLPSPDNDYARVMRGMLKDPTDLSRKRKARGCGLTGCLRTKHSTATIQRFAATLPGEAEPVSRYIRLAWTAVAPTIRAGTGAEHGSHTAPRPIHPDLPRCISAREAARLHSLPDWFRFHGTRWHDFRQIGNSVPPRLARAVARKLAEALNA